MSGFMQDTEKLELLFKQLSDIDSFSKKLVKKTGRWPVAAPLSILALMVSLMGVVFTPSAVTLTLALISAFIAGILDTNRHSRQRYHKVDTSIASLWSALQRDLEDQVDDDDNELKSLLSDCENKLGAMLECKSHIKGPFKQAAFIDVVNNLSATIDDRIVTLTKELSHQYFSADSDFFHVADGTKPLTVFDINAGRKILLSTLSPYMSGVHHRILRWFVDKRHVTLFSLGTVTVMLFVVAPMFVANALWPATVIPFFVFVLSSAVVLGLLKMLSPKNQTYSDIISTIDSKIILDNKERIAVTIKKNREQHGFLNYRTEVLSALYLIFNGKSTDVALQQNDLPSVCLFLTEAESVCGNVSDIERIILSQNISLKQ